MKGLKLSVQITTKAEEFNAFSPTVLRNVNNQFGGYNDASHRKLKSTLEKNWSWYSRTTSIVLEKQLLETFAIIVLVSQKFCYTELALRVSNV